MILERFMIARFLSYLLVLFFGLVGLYLLIEAFESLPDFLDAGVNFLMVLIYFCLISMRIIYQLSPLIILLAGLVTLVTMGKSRELMALRSIGISTHRILMPILVSAFLLSMLFTLMQIFIVPGADRTATLIMSRATGRDMGRGMVREEGRLYYRGEGSILSAEIITPDASVLADVEWMFFDRDYDLFRFIAASQARYEKDKWIFVKGMKEEGGKVVFFDQLPFVIKLAPQDLAAVETPVEEASVFQLLKAALRLKRLSMPYHEQETALLSQLFYSLLGFSLLFACLPLVFFRIQGGAALGLVLGTGLGFAVWAIWNMLLSMGKTGAVSPVLAVAGPHLLLIGAGFWARKRFQF